MKNQDNVGLTGLGKFISFVLIAGLIAVGGYVFWANSNQPLPEVATDKPADTAVPDGRPPSIGGPSAQSPRAADSPRDQPQEKPAAIAIAEMKRTPDRLPAPAPYKMQGDVVEIELSEYAGYAGLIVANGGLEPNDSSYFKQKHGFKLKIKLSEEESWPALNQGKMAASATTVDVLAVYGRQFDVVVPAQIGFSRGADGVVVRSDIKRINQLKGQNVIVPQFTEGEYLIRYLAQEAGLAVAMLPGLDSPRDPDKLNLAFADGGFEAGDAFLADLQAGGNQLAGCVTWAPKTTEVADESDGKAVVLATNRNLLIIADVLVVNRGFAQANPKVVAGLVDGLLHGNALVRAKPDEHLDLIAKAFDWDKAEAKVELTKVHLSNGAENVAFFAGALDAAGSFGGIFNSAVLAYGPAIIPNPSDSDRFLGLTALKAMETDGAFKDQQISIAPIRTTTASGALEVNPLLSKDIRFFFEPNSDELDGAKVENTKMLADIKRLLQVSPGSTLLLRGHVDPGRVADFRKQGGEELVRQQAMRAMDLSKRRAARVKTLLVEQERIDAGRIDAVGRGWEEPAGKSQSENMRVEVQWFTLE